MTASVTNELRVDGGRINPEILFEKADETGWRFQQGDYYDLDYEGTPYGCAIGLLSYVVIGDWKGFDSLAFALEADVDYLVGLEAAFEAGDRYAPDGSESPEFEAGVEDGNELRDLIERSEQYL